MGKYDINAMRGMGKLFRVPQDPNDKEFLYMIDKRTKLQMARNYNILLDYDWECNTIANCFLETVINNLAVKMKEGSKNFGIALGDTLNIIVSIKTNDKAEKEGNINIYFEPGKKLDSFISDGPGEIFYDSPVDVNTIFLTGDVYEDDLNKALCHHARYNLASNYGIVFSDSISFGVMAIALNFLENIYLEILQRLQTEELAEGEERLISVNFNDLIEIHGVMKDNRVAINMRPGMFSKLLIKSDESTEDTMGDDE